MLEGFLASAHPGCNWHLSTEEGWATDEESLFFQRRLKTGQPQRERLPFGKIDCVWRIKNGPFGSGRSYAVG